jgi:galactokinase
MDDARLVRLVEETKQQFLQQIGHPPRWIAVAPGRVNLIGEHIDYNDGFVLPMAIERYVVIAADLASNEDRISLHSVDLNESVELSLSSIQHAASTHWATYAQGVIAGIIGLGNEVPAFDAVLQSDVPLGGGLSSSAALEVATSTLIEAMIGRKFDRTQKALLCQKAEHDFAGVPCGIMDQFSSVFGQADHLMLLDCRSQLIEQLPFGSADVTILIINSNVKHALVGGEYAIRRSQCDSALRKLRKSSWREVTLADVERSNADLNQEELKRARHVVTEISRTSKAAEAIKQSSWRQLGDLMYASHQSLRDDYEVSCQELDLLVEIAQDIGPAGGMIGSRMTGGGFGGCTVSLIESSKSSEISDAITKRYAGKTSITPTCFTSRPARGAHLVLG